MAQSSSRGSSEEVLERTPIQAALYRRPLVFGVPKDVFVIEAPIALILFVVAWPSWFLVGVAVLILVIHVQLAKLCREDPRKIDLIVEAMAFPEVLARTPGLVAKRIPYWRSIPEKK